MKPLERFDLFCLAGGFLACLWLLTTLSLTAPFLATGIVLLTLSGGAVICHFLCSPIAHLFAGATWAFGGIFILIRMGETGFSIWRTLVGIGLFWSVWESVQKYRHRNIDEDENDDEEENSTMISMVALVRKLPFMDDTVLRHHVTNAWGTEFDPTDDDATSFVVGDAPMFVVQCDIGMFIVHYFDSPYFDDVDEIVDSTRDLRIVHALQEHRAWISVDFMTDTADRDDFAPLFAPVGKLLSQIIDDDCLALVVPSRQQIFPWEPEFANALQSDNPLETLCPELAPVIQVSDDDPRLTKAVQEARDTFHEFAAAFENRKDGDDIYAVKAPVTSGDNTEFIWVNVTAIENGIIYGTLGNDPVDLGDLRDGDAVRVEVSDLNDWMYHEEDNLRGGYTVKVLTEIQAEPKDGE